MAGRGKGRGKGSPARKSATAPPPAERREVVHPDERGSDMMVRDLQPPSPVHVPPRQEEDVQSSASESVIGVQQEAANNNRTDGQAPPNWQTLLHLLTQMGQQAGQAGPEGDAVAPLLQQIAQSLVREVPQRPPAPEVQPPAEFGLLRGFIKDMKSLNCEEYRGNEGPEIAYEWITKVEYALLEAGIPDEYKVKVAANYLKGDAMIWWKTIRERRMSGVMCPWDEFKRQFNQEYFTAEMIREKQQEFLALKQGNQEVRHYERRFQKLATFAPQLVATDRDRVELFVNGLRPELVPSVAALRAMGQPLRTISETAQATERALRWKTLMPPPRSAFLRGQESRFHPGESSRPGGENRKRDFGAMSQSGSQAPTRNTTSRYPKCARCRREHPGNCQAGKGQCYVCGGPHPWIECKKRNIKCFECGDMGHYQNECPRPRRPRPQGGTPAFSQVASSAPRAQIQAPMQPGGRGSQVRPAQTRTQGARNSEAARVFHLEQAEALHATNAVTGMLF